MDYILDDVIKEITEIRHSPDICYACDKCGPGSDQCFIQDAIGYLKEYRILLQGMQDKGIKTVTLADKQTVISAEPKAEQTEEKVSHVVMDSGNLVCECGQGVERWHMYCYHCGKKLVWDKVE